MSRPRLYLVRHGETDWNAEGRLLSFTDAPLNAHGESQAARLAAELAPVHWQRVVASPLRRARRTAEVLLAAHERPPALEIDDRLREMDFGPYEGWTESELAADPVADRRRRQGEDIPGVEPLQSVAGRAAAFLESLDLDAGPTLVVGHGRMLRVLIATALGQPPTFSAVMRMRNCRPAIIEPGPRPLLLAFNAGDATLEALGGE